MLPCSASIRTQLKPPVDRMCDRRVGSLKVHQKPRPGFLAFRSFLRTVTLERRFDDMLQECA